MEAILNRTDFEFYLKFTKPLVLNLPDAKDRVLAASWVRKLKEEAAGPEVLRTQYLKLLLFVLQKRKLVGVFADNPTKYDVLTEFPEDYNLTAIAKEILEKEQQEKAERNLKRMKGELGDFPPFSTDFSADFREYVAAQDIPNFGVHAYYAIGIESLPSWENADKGRYPKVPKTPMETDELPSTVMTLSSPLFTGTEKKEKPAEVAEELPPKEEDATEEKKVEFQEPKK